MARLRYLVQSHAPGGLALPVEIVSTCGDFPEWTAGIPVEIPVLSKLPTFALRYLRKPAMDRAPSPGGQGWGEGERSHWSELWTAPPAKPAQ